MALLKCMYFYQITSKMLIRIELGISLYDSTEQPTVVAIHVKCCMKHEHEQSMALIGKSIHICDTFNNSVW